MTSDCSPEVWWPHWPGRDQRWPQHRTLRPPAPRYRWHLRCNVCTLHPKRRCLITLHYNLAESLSHQDHRHYHTNMYFHHFPVDNYGVLDFYKSWVDTCERWRWCYRQWVELVERTKTFSIATLDQVMCAQSVAVQCMHFKLDRHVLRYFYAPLKVFKSV